MACGLFLTLAQTLNVFAVGLVVMIAVRRETESSYSELKLWDVSVSLY